MLKAKNCYRPTCWARTNIFTISPLMFSTKDDLEWKVQNCCRSKFFKRNMTYDPWHVPCDTWHMTCDTWWGVSIHSKFQFFSSYCYGQTVFWRLGGKRWPTHWINNEGVCWTAPTTPGPLNTQRQLDPI